MVSFTNLSFHAPNHLAISVSVWQFDMNPDIGIGGWFKSFTSTLYVYIRSCPFPMGLTELNYLHLKENTNYHLISILYPVYWCSKDRELILPVLSRYSIRGFCTSAILKRCFALLAVVQATWNGSKPMMKVGLRRSFFKEPSLIIFSLSVVRASAWMVTSLHKRIEEYE